MTTLSSVISQVRDQAKNRSDLAIGMRSMIPTVGAEGVNLRIGGKKELSFTKTGLSSFLQKINVPTGFFNRSSKVLKKQILDEHFPNATKKKEVNVFLRLQDDRIRYMASEKYGFFDDLDVVNALEKVEPLTQLNIRSFHQNEDHFILRATTVKPIEGKSIRPFYPGVHIENSETGLSMVRVNFLLYEQVCTNGAIVEKGFKSYQMKHLGQRKDNSILVRNVSEVISHLPEFTRLMTEKLSGLSQVKAQDILDKLEQDTRIPKAIKESLPEKIGNYTTPGQAPTGLEALSAYTEAIQRYNWDSRPTMEAIAGEYIMA